MYLPFQYFGAKTSLLLTLSNTLNSTSAALCNSALGMKSGAIRNAQITASSIWNKYHTARLARLGTVKRGRYVGAWCARHNNHHQWLKVDFGRPMKIKKIETQGRQDTNQWVTRYQLSYSQDGSHRTLYRYKSNDKVEIKHFMSNCLLQKYSLICIRFSCSRQGQRNAIFKCTREYTL